MEGGAEDHFKSRSVVQPKIIDSQTKLKSGRASSVTLDEEKQITSSSYCVFDANSKTILQGKKFNVQREVASLTKMMNLITCIKLMTRFNMSSTKLYVTINRNTSRIIGTTAGLQEGDVLQVE